MYKVAGFGADVSPNLSHAAPVWKRWNCTTNPWLDLYRRETARYGDPKKALAGPVHVAGHRRQRGGLVAGAAQTATRCLSTLRLGDGVDDAAFKAVPQFANLRCLNVMRTYAVSDLRVYCRACYRHRRRGLITARRPGPSQNADAVARVLATTPAAASLKVLALSDHAQTEPQHLHRSRFGSVRRFPAARPLLVDDAGALTVRGVAQFLGRRRPCASSACGTASAKTSRGAGIGISGRGRGRGAPVGAAGRAAQGAGLPGRSGGVGRGGRACSLDLRALCLMLDVTSSIAARNPHVSCSLIRCVVVDARISAQLN